MLRLALEAQARLLRRQLPMQRLLLRRRLPLLLPLLVQHHPVKVPLLHSLLRLLLRRPAAAIEGRHSAWSECDGDHVGVVERVDQRVVGRAS